MWLVINYLIFLIKMRIINIKLASVVLVTGLAILFSSRLFAAEDAALAQAEQYIRQENFTAAYKLLEPLEASRAGEPNFDYLFGISAVESGNATRGAFALERVLALDPNNSDARAEMAKAHFILGETDTSKAELNNLLQHSPDEQMQKTITKMLTSIDKLEGTTTTYGAYLDFGLGWDSNVSSASNVASVQIAAGVPTFGGLIVPLDKNSREQSDGFMNLAGGISFRHPFTAQVAAFGAASSTNRFNGDKHLFDTKSLDFNAGVDFRPNDNNAFTLALQDGHFSLDDNAFRHAYGASAQWLHNIDANNQAGLYGQYSRLKYNGNEIRNADRGIVGINAGHVFQGNLQPVLFASLYGGREDARDSRVNFLDQDIWGLRTGGQLNFDAKWQAFATFAYELHNYQGLDPAFLTKREDDQYDTSIGLRYSAMRDWTIKPQISYTRNNSNIQIDDYSRGIISISIRKDFNW